MPPNGDFTNDNKSYDLTRPMHRIQSPSTNADNQTPDGKGFDCGCRSVKDYISTDFDQFLSFLGKTGLAAIPGIGQILSAIASGTGLLDDLIKFIENSVEGQMFAR